MGLVLKGEGNKRIVGHRNSTAWKDILYRELVGTPPGSTVEEGIPTLGVCEWHQGA